MDNQKDAYSDPLRLHLKRQVARLLDMFPADSPIAALRYVSSRKVLLDQLSTLLHLPRYTMAIATLFKPLLLDLCARWLHHGMEHEEKFEALCLLLEPYQELYPYVYLIFGIGGNKLCDNSLHGDERYNNYAPSATPDVTTYCQS